jgi:hypothetical protein
MVTWILILAIGLLIFGFLKIVTSFLFRKKVELIRPDLLIEEVNAAKKMANQILVIYEGGYWEIKQEEHSKEWTANAGSQSFVNLNTSITDKRYKLLMNKELERDQEGEQHIKVLKEIDIVSTTNVEELSHIKV